MHVQPQAACQTSGRMCANTPSTLQWLRPSPGKPTDVARCTESDFALATVSPKALVKPSFHLKANRLK